MLVVALSSCHHDKKSIAFKMNCLIRFNQSICSGKKKVGSIDSIAHQALKLSYEKTSTNLWVFLAQ